MMTFEFPDTSELQVFFYTSATCDHIYHCLLVSRRGGCRDTQGKERRPHDTKQWGEGGSWSKLEKGCLQRVLITCI